MNQLYKNLCKYYDVRSDNIISSAFSFENELFRKMRLKKPLDDKILHCKKCKGLNIKRVTEVAVGWGNVNAKIFFIGQSLGRQNMQTGLPFTEKSGYSIDAALKIIGLTRLDVFMSNVVHCHTPENRPNKEFEITNCIWYLKREIEIVNPELLVLLGSCARKTVKRYIDVKCDILELIHPASFFYNNRIGLCKWIIDLAKKMKQYNSC